MKYIYGLYSPSMPGDLRYIGQSVDPAGRLGKHWASRNHSRGGREWERRLTEWMRTLYAPPVMKILLTVEDGEADRAEHDAIVEARRSYGSGQILNDNDGVGNRQWFRSVMKAEHETVEHNLERARTPEENAAFVSEWKPKLKDFPGAKASHYGIVSWAIQPIETLRAHRRCVGNRDDVSLEIYRIENSVRD